MIFDFLLDIHAMINVGKTAISIANVAVTAGLAKVNPESGNNSFP